MTSRSDVEARPGVDEQELVAAVTGGGETAERTGALKELLRRGPARVRPVVERIVLDGSAPSELRTTAAVALGRQATADNERVLSAALTADDPHVVAAAAAGLARIGGRAAFDALSSVTAGPAGGAARSVAFARTLLSYRLGLGTHRLAEPEAVLALDPGRATPFRIEGVAPDPTGAARRWLAEELPATPVTEAGSFRFRCLNAHIWVVLSEEVAGRPAGAVAERDRVAAVVLKESTCPDGWHVYEYVLSHPREGRGAAVFGVRPTGKLVHFGELTERDGTTALHLRAVDAPGTPALDFRADLTPTGTLTVRDAAYSRPATRRNPPATPTRSPSPTTPG
ncbi:HEAT repeat domain-containing protein [Actinosynnema sp. CS-041913]|uniref:HEAT repeat domain-containing protein n=1 Tax=Actinosynnema sp. CS-041913 TaxID=3239917 RepID=UPI003D8D1D6E